MSRALTFAATGARPVAPAKHGARARVRVRCAVIAHGLEKGERHVRCAGRETRRPLQSL